MQVVVKGKKVKMDQPLIQLCLMEMRSEVFNKEEKDKVPIWQQPARKAVHDAKQWIKAQAKELFSGENILWESDTKGDQLCVCVWNSMNKQRLLNLVKSRVDLTKGIIDF